MLGMWCWSGPVPVVIDAAHTGVTDGNAATQSSTYTPSVADHRWSAGARPASDRPIEHRRLHRVDDRSRTSFLLRRAHRFVAHRRIRRPAYFCPRPAGDRRYRSQSRASPARSAPTGGATSIDSAAPSTDAQRLGVQRHRGRRILVEPRCAPGRSSGAGGEQADEQRRSMPPTITPGQTDVVASGTASRRRTARRARMTAAATIARDARARVSSQSCVRTGARANASSIDDQHHHHEQETVRCCRNDKLRVIEVDLDVAGGECPGHQGRAGTGRMPTAAAIANALEDVEEEVHACVYARRPPGG